MNTLNPPSHPQAKEFVLLLNSEQREYFEERAAIYEFVGCNRFGRHFVKV